jgi:hypothetical protein
VNRSFGSQIRAAIRRFGLKPGDVVTQVQIQDRLACWTPGRCAKLGRISYRLLILTILVKKVTPHHIEKDPHTYASLVLAGAPLARLVTWLFADVFEFPVQRHRSWRSLLAAARPGHPTIVEPPVERDASPDDRPTRAPAQVG